MLTHIYLGIGIGVYLGCASNNLKTFKNCSIPRLISGLLVGVFLWPFALTVSVIWNIKYR